MPAFLLAGLPALGNLITGLISGLVGFFAQVLTKRLAIVALAVTVAGGLTAAFHAAMVASVQAIQQTLPPVVLDGMGLIVPQNAPGVVLAVFTAQSLRWVYDWQVKIVSWKAR